MQSTCYSCQILMALEFFQCIFGEKNLNVKLYENLSSGRRVVPCGMTDGRTDGHDEANSRFFPILRRRLKNSGRQEMHWAFKSVR
jgi:hypothetical protein